MVDVLQLSMVVEVVVVLITVRVDIILDLEMDVGILGKDVQLKQTSGINNVQIIVLGNGKHGTSFGASEDGNGCPLSIPNLKSCHFMCWLLSPTEFF